MRLLSDAPRLLREILSYIIVCLVNVPKEGGHWRRKVYAYAAGRVRYSDMTAKESAPRVPWCDKDVFFVINLLSKLSR